jgi:hypothetical protein
MRPASEAFPIQLEPKSLFSRRRRSGPSNREQGPPFACAHASLTGGAIPASGGEFALIRPCIDDQTSLLTFWQIASCAF